MWALIIILTPPATADLVFVDFNSTQGLVLNGDASTSACADVEIRSYGPREDKESSNGAALATVFGEDSETSFERTTRTEKTQGAEEESLCAGRVRLTPSRPGTRGSAWYHLAAPVAGGFETTFSFKITAPSRHCSRHRDLDLSLEMFEICAVAGGDGLAFVVHVDPNGTKALGAGGGHLGYSGIRASLAVEFDLDYNPTADAAPVDHVELRSRGNGPNSAFSDDARLVPFVPHDLADGAIHFAKIAYLPDVDLTYFGYFEATRHADRFMRDAGEHRRLGLFLVWLDDGIAADHPAIAIPLNLPHLLGLGGDGAAYIGFTAATGQRWQNHDILSWYVCDRQDCRTSSSSERDLFVDYHTKSRTSAHFKPFAFNPTRGFGGTVGDLDDSANLLKTPTKHTSPANDPMGPPPNHYSSSRHHGLAPDAHAQKPPNTEF
ncbi:hypothetical protein CTAYLR_007074 [Chrysophaeum taylorii]|uniref:Legume lectin domain-containing protein n=1 Tax=Chrysophaeum taylorii TaxID=2483200 RepID=A0AAD7UK73_9STRA|nr:hypothetical protein CTAYLR_007074 [Chrysophaeum taylorii]